jgi:iron(III) transport system ATP-binding protein
MAYLVFNQVTKQYHDQPAAVRDFSLEIRQGEFVSLLGPSGCGKTTVLRMLAGFLEPNAGEIFLAGQPLFSRARGVNVPPEQRQIGMVFQSYAVWPHMTVFDNVSYPLRVKRQAKAEIGRRVAAMLRLVNLSGLEKRYPHELSGGQQQRVAIARAMVMEPAVLLLDEPLSSLDAKLREKMCREIDDIRRRTGITVLYVTHDQHEAISLSDRIVLMHKGGIVQTGSPAEVYERPVNVYTADFLGKANIVTGVLTDQAAKGIGLGDGVFLPVGQIEGCAETKGQPVTLVCRPHHVRLSPADTNGDAAGTVTYCQYFGAWVEYGVRFGEAELRAEASADQFFRRGDRVRVQIQKAIALRPEDHSLV